MDSDKMARPSSAGRGGEENAFKKGYTLKKRSTPREVELEKENAQLREEVEILKKAAAFLANVKRDWSICSCGNIDRNTP